MPLEGADLLARRSIPQAGGLSHVRSARAAIGAEGDGTDCLNRPHESADLLARRSVPQAGSRPIDPVSTRSPSGLKATDDTPPSCPLKTRSSFRSQHPTGGRSCPMRSGQHARAIGAEGDGVMSSFAVMRIR